MSNYRLHTELRLAPSSFWRNKTSYLLVRGATGEFDINFDDYLYLKPAAGEPWYKYIEQMTFIFKHNDDTKVYKLFGRGINKKSEIPVGEDPNDYVNDLETAGTEGYYFKVPSASEEEFGFYTISLIINKDGDKGSLSWEVTDEDDAYEFEIAMDIDTYDESSVTDEDQGTNPILLTDSVIIEKQAPVIIADSLYSHVEE